MNSPLDNAHPAPVSRVQLAKLTNEAIGERVDQHLGVVLIAFDGLHAINTTIGYATGDHLLGFVRNQLAEEFRAVDTVVTTTHDQVAIILPALKNESHAMLAANKALRSVRQLRHAYGLNVPIAVRIGVGVYPVHAACGETLVQRADIALNLGRSGVRELTVATAAVGNEPSPAKILGALERAISASELQLYYQPQIDFRTRQISGVEALTRWFDPELGFVSPDVFISLAETNGLIKGITTWSLNVALKRVQQWLSVWDGAAVALNLSAAMLQDEELMDSVAQALSIWNVDAQRLTLEVTESAMMDDPERCLATLAQLHELGVRLSIDDFGTGYSSLAYLSRLSVDELKIDKSFVMTMSSDESNRKIVRTVIDLAHNFDLHVVAEGIEDDRMLAELRELDCDYGQGFFISRPIPDAEFRKWLLTSAWAPTPRAAKLTRKAVEGSGKRRD